MMKITLVKVRGCLYLPPAKDLGLEVTWKDDEVHDNHYLIVGEDVRKDGTGRRILFYIKHKSPSSPHCEN